MFTEMPPEKQKKIVGEILGDFLYQQMIEEQKQSDNENERKDDR